MPAGGHGGGARDGSRGKEVKSKALDKNALPKQEAEANREPSAHAAKVLAKKAAAKEKVKARKATNAAKKEANSGANAQIKVARSEEKEVMERDRKMGWRNEDGNMSITGKL